MNTDFQNKTLPTVAVIPAAGKGTRFLPSTKSTPKELHPLLNKPLIHCCLEELKAAGVKEAIIVTHPDKTTLEKYFSNPRLMMRTFPHSQVGLRTEVRNVFLKILI